MSYRGRNPKCVQKTILGATTYATANNIIDIPTLFGAGKDAKFVQIEVLTDDTLNVKLNNDDECIISLNGPIVQIFNNGDARITSIKFDNSVSGATSADVQVIMSI